MVWRGLQSVNKKQKCFILLTSNKFAIQYNPIMQLRLILQETVDESELKNLKNFKTINLLVFQQSRKF